MTELRLKLVRYDTGLAIYLNGEADTIADQINDTMECESILF